MTNRAIVVKFESVDGETWETQPPPETTDDWIDEILELALAQAKA